jgi:hypothetical protein
MFVLVAWRGSPDLFYFSCMKNPLKRSFLLYAWAVLGFLTWFFGMNILFFGTGCLLGLASAYKGLRWSILTFLGKTKAGREENYFDSLCPEKGGGH